MAVGRTLPVSESIWLDSKVRELQNSDKYLFLYLLTNSHLEYVGIYELTYETMKYETDMQENLIKSGIDRLKDKDLIDYDMETKEVAILNYLKYSISAGGNPIKKRFMNLSKKVKSVYLMERVYAKTIENKDERDIYLFAQENLKNAIAYKKTGELTKVTDEENPYSNNTQKKQEIKPNYNKLIVVKNGDEEKRVWAVDEQLKNISCNSQMFSFGGEEKVYDVYIEKDLVGKNYIPYDEKIRNKK